MAKKTKDTTAPKATLLQRPKPTLDPSRIYSIESMTQQEKKSQLKGLRFDLLSGDILQKLHSKNNKKVSVSNSKSKNKSISPEQVLSELRSQKPYIEAIEDGNDYYHTFDEDGSLMSIQELSELSPSTIPNSVKNLLPHILGHLNSLTSGFAEVTEDLLLIKASLPEKQATALINSMFRYTTKHLIPNNIKNPKKELQGHLVVALNIKILEAICAVLQIDTSLLQYPELSFDSKDSFVEDLVGQCKISFVGLTTDGFLSGFSVPDQDVLNQYIVKHNIDKILKQIYNNLPIGNDYSKFDKYLDQIIDEYKL
jgi:hypothetical protein